MHDARAPDRDVLWVIALRAKLLRERADRRLEAMRTAAVVEVCRRNDPVPNVRRARVVPFVRRPRRTLARAHAP
jgi:hypothetical protein